MFYAFDGTEIIGEVVSSETPSETPADPEPTTPVQPEQPTEPTTPAEPETPAETPEEPSVTAPDGTVTYTVQKGDTLGFIATNYYGDNAQRNSDRLKNVNTIYEGQVLVLPAK